MAQAIVRGFRDEAAWSTTVGRLLRPPVTAPAITTAQQAAARMARERTPWLLVPSPKGWRVLTEQDLNERVLAAGRSPQTPIDDVAIEITTVLPSDRAATDALILMLESGLRHVPVVDDRRRILGVVSDTDLVGLEWRSPLALRNTIGSAQNVEAVVEAGRALPRTVWSMVEAGVDAVDAARVVTLVIDAMTRRLIDIGVQTLGTPPVPWAWLALGSAARREQGIVTDQDHALAFDPLDEPLEEVDSYFLELATTVTSGLESAGIPKCKAKVVAEERSLRRPLEHWVVAFTEWIADGRLWSGRQASILFDYRRAAGPLKVEDALGRVIGASPDHPRFLRQLAKQAVEARPPRHADGHGVDVKAAGLTPIVNLARSYALESGVSAAPTIDRLDLAAACGRIDQEISAGLREAFALLWRIRLERHAACVADGSVPDDRVETTSMGPLTRAELKEALRFIRRCQHALRRHWAP